jgi:hypothetical protein
MAWRRERDSEAAPEPAPAPRGAKLPLAVDAVLGLQRSAGNRATTDLLARKVVRSDAGTMVELTVGVELTPELARAGWDRTRDGALDDADLAALRAVALSKLETIDDSERLFMAALLETANVRKLHAEYPRGFGEEAQKVHFDGASIPAANRDRVKNFGRNVRPQGAPISEAQEKAERGTDKAIDREMLLMAGVLSYTVTQALELADEAKIGHLAVYYAMLNGASDSTPMDRAMAAAVYVVARREGLPEAADILAGRIKVDTIPAHYLPGEASGMYQPEAYSAKGDTVYLPIGLDPSNISDQGTIVHELTHAADDKANAGKRTLDVDAELHAYRREARFYLDSIAKMKPDARKKAVEQVGKAAKDYLIHCLILEANASPEEDFAMLAAIVEEINDESYPVKPAEVRRGLNTNTKAQNEANARRGITTTYKLKPGQGSTTGGLRGESALD